MMKINRQKITEILNWLCLSDLQQLAERNKVKCRNLENKEKLIRSLIRNTESYQTIKSWIQSNPEMYA